MRKFTAFTILLIAIQPLVLAASQAAVPRPDLAEQLLAQMTPEERVGQLFLVTFDGPILHSDSPIYELVTRYHVSGVILKSDRNNFSDTPDTILDLRQLITDLQNLKHESALLSTLDQTGSPPESEAAYVPLFIGINYGAGTSDTAEILSGLSDIPSAMSIGATWDTQVSQNIGSLLGTELEALGFNLMIGPSLDVLENPELTGSNALGTRSFGGDPYWVGSMGSAFIEGVHAGSDSRIAVIANHFPGLGSGDRPISEEVATVRKSLEQLKQIELFPFFVVTGNLPGEAPGITDGLLTAHIRYQGFQGNIRATTRPVSLDQQAFNQLMALEPLASWREGGGIAMSDSLGSRAIRRFRDPTEQTFQAHIVARDAFLAGNDLLLLDDFRDSNDPNELTTIKNTLQFFANRYAEDSLFAERVDGAVLRILRLKLRLYEGSFTYSAVVTSQSDVSAIGRDRSAAAVAQSAASLISPTADEVLDRLGGAPAFGDRIVFFTDVQTASQCDRCDAQAILSTDALERAVLRFYGPGAAGEVGGWNLRSFSTADLANYLGLTPPNTPSAPLSPVEDVDAIIHSADWMVFVVRRGSENRFGSDALKILLDQRPDLARDKKLIVFAMDVPYILDATDISKVDAFYALYDNLEAFIEMAAKLLYFEATAAGSSPVSIQGVGYDLIEVTAPDPNQIIQLLISQPEAVEGVQGYSVGDLVQLETGIIRDKNGHPVPDRTPVDFMINQQSEDAPALTMSSFTVDGSASISLALERTGLITVSAQSGSAHLSETLQLNVQLGVPAQATVISPTRVPTATSEPTRTPATASPTPGSAGDPGTGSDKETYAFGWTELILGLFSVAIVGVVGYYMAGFGLLSDRIRVRCALIGVVAALLGYNYFALQLPGSKTLMDLLGPFAGFGLGLLAGGLGLISIQGWYLNRKNT